MVKIEGVPRVLCCSSPFTSDANALLPMVQVGRALRSRAYARPSSSTRRAR